MHNTMIVVTWIFDAIIRLFSRVISMVFFVIMLIFGPVIDLFTRVISTAFLLMVLIFGPFFIIAIAPIVLPVLLFLGVIDFFAELVETMDGVICSKVSFSPALERR